MPPPWMPWKWCMGGGDSLVRTDGMMPMCVPNVARWLWMTATTAPTAVQRWMVMGMYDSPINIDYGRINVQLEGDILKAVQDIGVTVDKEQLLAALEYDRNQYCKGYSDAVQERGLAEVVRCKDCKYFKPAHFKADDGTEEPWDETFSFDGRSDGIHYGARCKHERNTAYGQKDMAFRKADDFCSYGERKDNDNQQKT